MMMLPTIKGKVMHNIFNARRTSEHHTITIGAIHTRPGTVDLSVVCHHERPRCGEDSRLKQEIYLELQQFNRSPMTKAVAENMAQVAINVERRMAASEHWWV